MSKILEGNVPTKLFLRDNKNPLQKFYFLCEKKLSGLNNPCGLSQVQLFMIRQKILKIKYAILGKSLLSSKYMIHVSYLGSSQKRITLVKTASLYIFT